MSLHDIYWDIRHSIISNSPCELPDYLSLKENTLYFLFDDEEVDILFLDIKRSKFLGRVKQITFKDYKQSIIDIPTISEEDPFLFFKRIALDLLYFRMGNASEDAKKYQALRLSAMDENVRLEKLIQSLVDQK